MQDSPDLKAATTGTRYFVSNPSILQVSADGLITTLDEGVATVTVIYGAVESVVPVRIEAPSIGVTQLGLSGGVVQELRNDSMPSALVMVAPNALNQTTSVQIEQIRQEQLALPVPENFTFGGAFELSMGSETLNVPVQLAIPNTMEIATGTEVFIMREGQFLDETGTTRRTWFIEESGRVSADGMIRTQSPPWNGVRVSGQYSIAIPKFRYTIGTLATSGGYVGASLDFPTIVALSGIPQVSTTLSPSRFFTPAGSSVTGYQAPKPLPSVPYDPTRDIPKIPVLFDENALKVDVVIIPRVELPYRTSAGVSLNLSQITPGTNPVVASVELSPPPRASTTEPIIQNTTLEFDTQGAFLRVTGKNLGQEAQNLRITWKYGWQQFQAVPTLQMTPDGQGELILRLPSNLPASPDRRCCMKRGCGWQRHGKF